VNSYSVSSRNHDAILVTDRAGILPIGRRLGPRLRALTCDQTAMRRPGLPFNGRHVRLTIQLTTPEGWMAELTWFVDP